jgi:hypothetical protein
VSSLPILVTIPDILTPMDHRKRRLKRMVWSLATLVSIGVCIFAFHTLVMDINIFWAKLMRKLPPM